MSEPDAPLPPHVPTLPTEGPPLVVLDTQVVMDWLVFGNQELAPLIAAVESRRLHWIATAAMRAELLHVLGRGIAARYAPDQARIQEVFSRHCQMLTEPILALGRPRCSDPDDQKFIDLALAFAASHPRRLPRLISRDRAVLKVAKRASRLGLQILSPTTWLKLHGDT